MIIHRNEQKEHRYQSNEIKYLKDEKFEYFNND